MDLNCNLKLINMKLFYHLYGGENDPFLKNPYSIAFKETISIHPLKNVELMKMVHLAELRHKVSLIKNKIYGKTEQNLKPPVDLQQKNLKFFDARSFYDLDSNKIKTGFHPHFNDFINYLNYELSKHFFTINSNYSQSRIVFGYFQTDPNDDNLYMLTHNFLKEKNTTSQLMQNIAKENVKLIIDSREKLIIMESHYMNQGSKLVPNDEIIFFVDVDFRFHSEILYRILANTRINSQVYMPIVFSQFNTYNGLNENSNVIRRGNGEWRHFGFGALSIYKNDFNRIEFNENITQWGKEDIELTDQIIKLGNIRIFRSVDPGIVHIYHNQNCMKDLPKDQFQMCLMSKFYQFIDFFLELVQIIRISLQQKLLQNAFYKLKTKG
ncbi:Chondroitin sulfate synthase 1 [Brachionus plicatilis]|uniref:Hexosyltransferase n=1 Tax=Brachionus plicatilis TaxID=10195 RepID=A0A3M7T7R9_BRAPC|nr:Chondroitin sulfate synthase 1 [Brachionus plicatilis]